MTVVEAAPEFLTVPELAALLRIKERKVYDLAASGSVPCTRATGKLLFPEADVRAWISGAGSAPGSVARPAVFLGSHDPLLEWALRQSECGLATFFDGSQDGMNRFVAGEGVAVGVHLHEPGGWNVGHVSKACDGQGAVLISWVTRARGLVVRDAALTSVADIKGCTVAKRQAGSGADLLTQHLIKDAGLTEPDVRWTEDARSEEDAVLAVVDGSADVAFGLQAMAKRFGLGFVPLMEEQFDLLIDRKAYFGPEMQRLLRFCQGEAFAARVQSLPGYGCATLGEVRWNA